MPRGTMLVCDLVEQKKGHGAGAPAKREPGQLPERNFEASAFGIKMAMATLKKE